MPLGRCGGCPQDFAEVLGHIQQTRQRVLAQANTALIDLYWRIGQTLSHKVAQAGWGKGVVTELARYIVQADPTIHGFSDKNLWRMKQFYEAHQGDGKLSALARVLPWTHNTTIFSRCKSVEDPITSLDDNNAIAVASDLAKLLRKAKSRTRPEAVMADGPGEVGIAPRMVPAPIKAVVSSHHALFFNVVCNELKKTRTSGTS